jgi:hypothetical protein
MKTWKIVLLVVGLVFAGWIAYQLNVYNDNETWIVGEPQQYRSPDGSRLATVSVYRHGWPFTSSYSSSVTLEGGPDAMPETYVLSLSHRARSVGLTAHWLSPTRLEFSYHGDAVVNLNSPHEDDVTITLHDLSKEKSSNGDSR